MLENANARVTKAFDFLSDEWLVDVATDLNGKCVLIALALSIIERILFPERPVFFVTAGLRGGGKTTAITMVSLAVLGIRPGAAAWSHDPNERKKSIFSYLREGLPLLVWDNIANGSAIGCAHIEAASTGAIFRDRVLGEAGPRRRPPIRSWCSPETTSPRGAIWRRARSKRASIPTGQTPKPQLCSRRPMSLDARPQSSWAIRSSCRTANAKRKRGSRCGGGWSGRRLRTRPNSRPGKSFRFRGCSRAPASRTRTRWHGANSSKPSTICSALQPRSRPPRCWQSSTKAPVMRGRSASPKKSKTSTAFELPAHLGPLGQVHRQGVVEVRRCALCGGRWRDRSAPRSHHRDRTRNARGAALARQRGRSRPL